MHPLHTGPRRHDDLLALIGDARFAPLDEASHGTHKFYAERAEITKRLLVEKRFTAIAVDAEADAALSGFQRFPA
jgi:erythromycin esterase-like protein